VEFWLILLCQAPTHTQSPSTELQIPPIENFLATVLRFTLGLKAYCPKIH